MGLSRQTARKWIQTKTKPQENGYVQQKPNQTLPVICKSHLYVHYISRNHTIRKPAITQVYQKSFLFSLTMGMIKTKENIYIENYQYKIGIHL